MTLALDPRHYAGLSVLFWPILFLRLLALDRWMQATQRGVAYSVTNTGRILIRYVDDAPSAQNEWQIRSASPRYQAALTNSNAHPDLHPFITPMAKPMERAACREIYIPGHRPAPPHPALQNSS